MMEESRHFQDMVRERGIDREWIGRALDSPDRVEDHEDGTRHFLKQVPEYGNRWLRVVVNVLVEPFRAVTVFFDRGLRDSQ